jgi:hypothetical protein
MLLQAAYILATTTGEWLLLFTACVTLTALLGWALWLHLSLRRWH